LAQGRDEDLNEVLVRSIDETIVALLGSRVLGAFHSYLEKFHNIKPDEIPYRLTTVHEVLSKIFGASWETVEKAAAKSLYTHLGLPFAESPDRTLSDYVEDAKARLARSSRGD